VGRSRNGQSANGRRSAPSGGSNIANRQREFSDRVKPSDLTRELGSSGLRQFGGRVVEEFLWELRDRKGMSTFKEMRENDPIISAVFQAITMQIRGVDWQASGAEGPDADAANEYAESLREDMSQTWEDVISETIEGMLTYGWQFLEIVYKLRAGANPEKPEKDSAYDDNRLGWRSLQPIAQDTLKRWVFDEGRGPQRGSLLGLEQHGDWGSTEDPFIPMEKALLFRTVTRKKNPEGRSILRGAYRPWFFKKKMEEIEGIGIERDLAGYPYLRPPEGTDLWNSSEPLMVQYRNWAEQLVRGIRRDELEGAVLPHGWELELLSTGGSRQMDVSAVIERYDRRIATVPLADVIMLGHEQVGSYALADSKTNLLGVSLGAWLDSIAAVFNRYAFPRLFRMSAFRLDKLPELTHSDVETIDPDIFLGALQKATAIGGVHLGPDDEVHIRQILGMPERTEEEIEEEAEERAAMAEEIAQTQGSEAGAEDGEGESGPSDTPGEGTGGAQNRSSGRPSGGGRGSQGQVEESDEEERRGRQATTSR
jgi:hypothetical protein